MKQLVRRRKKVSQGDPRTAQEPLWLVASVRNALIVQYRNVFRCRRQRGIPMGTGQCRRTLERKCLVLSRCGMESSWQIMHDHPMAFEVVSSGLDDVDVVCDTKPRHPAPRMAPGCGCRDVQAATPDRSPSFDNSGLTSQRCRNRTRCRGLTSMTALLV